MTAAGPGRLPITACFIALNEEGDLPGAMESIDFAAEVVVVVDSRTTDRTREVACALHLPERPVRVFEREWSGQVDQKNFALQQATSDWILCLDADERVSRELRGELVELFAGTPPAQGYSLPRRTFYLGRWMRGSNWYPDRKIRLLRRGQGCWKGVDPHDRLEVNGQVESLKGDLQHRSYRDLRDHLEKVDFFTAVAAREKLKSSMGHPLLRILIHSPARFIKMYLLRGGWRDGMQGMIAALMGAFYVFLKYAKLWELQEAHRRSPESALALDPRARPPGSPDSDSGRAT